MIELITEQLPNCLNNYQKKKKTNVKEYKQTALLYCTPLYIC